MTGKNEYDDNHVNGDETIKKTSLGDISDMLDKLEREIDEISPPPNRKERKMLAAAGRPVPKPEPKKRSRRKAAQTKDRKSKETTPVRHKQDATPKGRRGKRPVIILLLLMLIGCCIGAGFLYFRSNGHGTGKEDSPYNEQRFPKAFGTPELKPDENGNVLVILNTDIEPLNAAIDKITKQLLTKATAYEAHCIDCEATVLYDTVHAVNYMLYNNRHAEGEPVETVRVYYSPRSKQILSASALLRQNYRAIIKYRHPEIAVDKLDTDQFILEEDKAIFLRKSDAGGEPERYELKYEQYPDLWRPDSGVPSLFKGEWMEEPKPVVQDESKRKIAVLTFDDGPRNEWHAKIVELLDSYDIKGSFFFLGEAVEMNPDMVRTTFEHGHQVANHSWSHPMLTALSPEEQAKEILNTDDLLLSLTGRDAICMRPPYGAYNETTATVTNADISLWNVDSLDWQSRDKDTIVEQVKNNLQEESVILFHDLYQASYEAVEELIPYLLNQGYRFMRYDEYFKLYPEETPENAPEPTSE